MTVIRQTQMNAFAQTAFGKFVDRTERLLREKHPEATGGWTREVLCAWIVSGLARASALAIEDGRDVIKFLDLLLRHPRELADAAQTPEVQRILEDSSMDGWERVHELEYFFSHADGK
jgi:hypothetical protein